jgi:phosphoribosylanthranilate isomerase
VPRTKLVQVIHVRSDADVREALAIAPLVDELLLDSGNPNAAVRELGGTGRTHDWRLSRQIVEQAGKPVWLAGGLRAENVREAIAAVQPHGLDICSGVRVQGALDPVRLAAFVSGARPTA